MEIGDINFSGVYKNVEYNKNDLLIEPKILTKSTSLGMKNRPNRTHFSKGHSRHSNMGEKYKSSTTYDFTDDTERRLLNLKGNLQISKVNILNPKIQSVITEY